MYSINENRLLWNGFRGNLTESFQFYHTSAGAIYLTNTAEKDTIFLVIKIAAEACAPAPHFSKKKEGNTFEI